MSLIKKIAPSCQWVSEQASHVKIHYEKISAYAETILRQYALITAIDPHVHYVSKDKEETAAYVFALDSINFGSGYFHIAKECGIRLEYDVIAGGLKKAFEQRELNQPEQWTKVTPEYLSRLFAVPQGVRPKLDELLALFALHLREAGKRILTDYQGRVLHVVEQADYSALKLADTVAAWKGFHDVHTYRGREIPILKRAQILASDMNLVLSGLKDMDALTIFADNMVPHVLRCDGILEYDEGLALNIDCGMLIASGSEEEIEIRATAIHVVELMKQAAHSQGKMVTSVNIDHLLWHRGYEPALYKKPSHRTLTTDY